MDLLSKPFCSNLCVFIFIAQETEFRQEQHLWVLFWAEKGRHKQNICLQIELLCLLSLTRVYLIITGDWVWVRCQCPLCSTPSKVFDKSHELASHVLAIRLYCSQLEASFDSHLLPLIRPLFLVVYLVLVRFSWPAPLLGKLSCSVCFNKSGYGPIVHSHIAPTYVCLYLLPSKQRSDKSSIYGFCFGGERKT